MPKLVATSTAVINPANVYQDSENLPGETVLYGGDLTHGKKYHRFRRQVFSSSAINAMRNSAPSEAAAMGLAPYGHDLLSGEKCGKSGCKPSVGTTPEILKPKMRRLLDIFARGDTARMATRLFDKFLEAPDRPLRYFDDPALDAAAALHQNIIFFCDAALSAPNVKYKSNSGSIRIHQALENAGWDVDKLVTPRDLGAPAFNTGSWYCEAIPNKALGHACSLRYHAGDYNNGLGLMVNGIQRVYVLATHYHYDHAAKQYGIVLKYLFYDVFGLDDTDLERFGAEKSDSKDEAAVGITAWWQLQHEHGYTPLVTRMKVVKLYVAETH